MRWGYNNYLREEGLFLFKFAVWRLAVGVFLVDMIDGSIENMWVGYGESFFLI